MEDLGEGYDLSRWPALLSTPELRENLYLLDLLDRYLGRASGNPGGGGLDVGSKNGATLPALATFFPAGWDLVELDAHRRYWDLSTRRAHGERMARAYPSSRFYADSVTSLFGTYRLVTWVLPFVRPRPLEAWGLPRRFFQPAALLAHVLSRVAPGGTLFVVNQGEVECEAQQALFAEAKVAAEPLGRLFGALCPFERPRYGFRWTRPMPRSAGLSGPGSPKGAGPGPG